MLKVAFWLVVVILVMAALGSPASPPPPVRVTPANSSWQQAQFGACHVLVSDQFDPRQIRDCLVRDYNWAPPVATEWANDSTLR